LAQDGKNEQKVSDQYSAGHGIINDLIDDPHKRAGFSYFVGIFSGTVGITLYLKNWLLIGGALIALGIFTPLIWSGWASP